MVRHESFMMSDVWKSMWITMQSVRFVYVFWVWINGGTKKIVNICLLSLQKHKNILHSILLQFSPNLLFYTVLKHQIRPFPLYHLDQIYSHRPPAASPDRLAKSAVFSHFTAAASNKIARSPPQVGGWQKLQAV